jgi:hypothetical protein
MYAFERYPVFSCKCCKVSCILKHILMTELYIPQTIVWLGKVLADSRIYIVIPK